MADDSFTVRIDSDLAESVRAAAAASGVSVEAFVRGALESYVLADLEWSGDPDPKIDERIAEETLRRGDGIAWDTFRTRFKTFGQRVG
jgi:predicted transcriptional regulator